MNLSRIKGRRGQGNTFFVFLAVLSLIGIFAFPRFEMGHSAKIRLEDIIFVFLVFIVYFRFCMGKLKLYKESLFPLIYLTYLFIVSLIRWVFIPQESLHFIVFWGKDIQYFVLFLTFYYLFQIKRTKVILISLLLFVLLNTVFGLFCWVYGIKDYYGIPAIFLRNAASLSGQVYFSCSIMALLGLYLNLYVFLKTSMIKVLLFLLAFFAFLCCLATLSKSSSFGIFAFFVVFFFLKDCFSIKKRSEFSRKAIKWAFLSGLFVVLGFFMFSKTGLQIGKLDLRRLRNPVESTISRYKYDLKPKFLKLKGPLDYLMGAGYLAGQTEGKGIEFGSAFDSQYVRNILVSGIIGLLFWLFVLFYFAKCLWFKKKLFIFYCSLLISYLVMGIGLESFQLSKGGPIFWIISGILLGMARGAKEEVLWEQTGAR